MWRAPCGGLVSWNESGGIINTSYATGRVADGGGGLVGKNDSGGAISASYWDTQTSGQTVGVGDGDSTGVEGKTTAEFAVAYRLHRDIRPMEH